jgi:hypothetical protein
LERKPGRRRRETSQAFQRSMESMLKAWPELAPHVGSVKWDGDYEASVFLLGFRIDKLSAADQERFREVTRLRIDNVRKPLGIHHQVELDFFNETDGGLMTVVMW